VIGLLAQQLLALAGFVLVFGVPGWAISRLLEAHLRLPVVALPVAYTTFALGLWTLELLPSLALGWSIGTLLVVHGIVSVLLVVFARWREHTRGHAKVGTDALSGWTVVAIGLAGLVALGFRTRLAFDSLFHLGMIRRILELPGVGFQDVDRIVGSGINPAYAVPVWQAAMAAIAKVTGLDPATVLEAMAVVGVVLAACAAAALGRVVSGTVAGEVAAAAAYGWLRVFFPRRELEGDGVAYAALSGNIALDVMFVLALVVALLVLRSHSRRHMAPLVVLGVTAVVLLVVLHANYAVYLAIVGLGTAGWLVAAGPWNRDVSRRLARAMLLLALPGVVALGLLLPLLATLEHFGAPLEARIDYHLVTVAGHDLIRPGHLYDWFAVPGLLAMLVLPWAAWRARGAGRALIGGGALALLAFALVPPLLELLGDTGSLTLGLRLPRPLGIVMIAAAAVALPDLIERGSVLAIRAQARGGIWLRHLAVVAPFALVLALSFAYGYPLVRKEPPDYGWNWPTIVALAGLLLVLVLGIRSRSRTAKLDEQPSGAGIGAREVGITAIALAVCMLPSGLMSMRRAAWQAREVVAAYRADDLRCYDGVQASLRRLPAGEVLLADPVTGYGAQALAPSWIIGDFKVWNGSTDSARINRRIKDLDELFDSGNPAVAGAALTRLRARFDTHWLLVSTGDVTPPIGSELRPYDARGLRALLHGGRVDAHRVAAGEGRFDDSASHEDVEACRLELWKLDD
jgi:hypothetical protein